MCHRIILDRTIFPENGFKLLQASKLANLARSDQIAVMGNTTLMNETLMGFWNNPYSEKNKRRIKKEIEYIEKITSPKNWFLPLQRLWINEFAKQPIFTAPREVSTELKFTHRILKNRITTFDRAEINQGIREQEQINKSFHDWLVEERKRIAEILNKNNQKQSTIKQTFEEFYSALVDKHTNHFPPFVENALISKGITIEHWKKSKADYPYYTTYNKGLFYGIYESYAKSNCNIDQNFRADLSQLTYLQGADIIVSNEKKSMKRVFDALYGSSHKRWMRLEEFIKFIGQIST